MSYRTEDIAPPRVRSADLLAALSNILLAAKGKVLLEVSHFVQLINQSI